MKFINRQCCLLTVLVCVFSNAFVYAQPQPQSKLKTVHITIPLSDKVNYHFEKYLLFAYNQLGYKVIFDKILTARAREMVDAGRSDAMMVAEKEIVQVYKNILKVPVMLAKGALVLYCKKELNCDVSVLNKTSNVIGVISGHSLSANFMRSMQASTYAVKGAVNLGVMLIKDRVNYALIVNEDQLGNIGDFDDSQFQKVEVFRTEGYHFIHKKHKNLLPELTQALQLAIEKYGPLVKSDKGVN